MYRDLLSKIIYMSNKRAVKLQGTHTLDYYVFIKNHDMGEGNGNPLQYSCLEKSMDRGAWLAAVHGVT